jgi:hypothetical protein
MRHPTITASDAVHNNGNQAGTDHTFRANETVVISC